MLELAAVRLSATMPRMPIRGGDPPTDLKAIGRALAVLRKRAGLTQLEAAERIGLTAQAWQRYEAGDRQAILRSDLQERVLRAVEADREALAFELAKQRGEQPARSRIAGFADHRARHDGGLDGNLRICERIQAGAWVQTDVVTELQRPSLIAPEPRFGAADQWLAHVVGSSADGLGIVEGDLVHLVDADQSGYFARPGDIVEVDRTRFDGTERELSIRQVECDDQGVRLHLMASAGPDASPVRPGVEGEPGREITTRIRAQVIGLIRRFA